MRAASFLLFGALVSGYIFNKREEKAAPLLSSSNAEVLPGQYIVVYGSDIKEDDNSFDQHLSLLTSFINLSASKGQDENEITHIYNSTFLGYAGKFTQKMIDDIRLSGVEYVEQDQVVHTKETQLNAPWGLARISHKAALSFATYNKYIYNPIGGQGVTAYVIDTGINTSHVDFGGRASVGKIIPIGEDALDHNGHGTHVAGTIAGSQYGVAKKVRVKAVKVLKSNGSGTVSDVIGGVEYALTDSIAIKQKAQRTGDKTYRGSIANMSLGGGFSTSLNAAVSSAISKGLPFAVAAGNETDNACNSSPASVPAALTVGASTIGDDIAWFSNYGKCVDIFAPGLDIKSTWIGSNTAVNTISGTSMASPHIAGLAAYLLSLASAPLSTDALRTKMISLALPNLLTGIPAGTPNLLAYNGQ